MIGSAATITEHYEMIGEKRGELIGEKRGEMIGEKRGEIRGQIKVWEQVKANGDLPAVKCDQHIATLKAQSLLLEESQ